METPEGPVDQVTRIAEEGPEANPERQLWNRELSQGISAALEGLTPRERTVFELRHYEGLRLRAIGEILGTTEEAAKNCLFRATQKMRASLESYV
jgi:RNA polymerase sigma-70 factor (ECF subfamily)